MISEGLQSKILVLLAMVLGLFAGLISSTGSMLLAGAFIGAVLGACLALSIRTLFYVAMFFCLAICGLLEFYLFIGQANWLASGLCLVLMLISCATSLMRREEIKIDNSIYPVVIFFIMTMIAGGVINLIAPIQWLVGLRTYLPFIGVLLVFTTFLKQRDLEIIPILLVVVGLLQLPFCMHQFFVIGPLRNSTLASVGGSQEAMVGTFGGDMFGGGYTAEMAIFTLITACLAVALKGKGYVLQAFRYLMPLAALLCVALSETKIVILITPIVFCIIFWEELRASPKFFLGATISMLSVIALLIGVYALRFYGTGGDQLHALTYSFDPNFMVDRYHRGRMAALIHWWNNVVLSGDMIRALFGYGVASTLESSRVLGEGNAVKIFGLGLDAHAACKLLWDTGISGFLIFAWLLVRSARNANQILNRVQSVNIAATLKVSRGAMFIFAAMLPYQVAMFGGAPMQFLFWLFIGYIECCNRLFPAEKK